MKDILRLSERLSSLSLMSEMIRKALDDFGENMRVACPAVIESFDPDKQTVSAWCAIRKKIVLNGVVEDLAVPLLADMPIVIPEAGDYCLTLPIKKGNECLCLFADNCIDAWYQSGGVQNQIRLRCHSYSDGFAIIGIRSQPRTIPNYSTDTAQLRNRAGTAYVEIDGNKINVVSSEEINHTAPVINFTGAVSITFNTALLSWLVAQMSAHGQDGGAVGTITLEGTTITINGHGATSIDGKDFLPHKHGGVDPGSGQSGGVI
jgi:hypothetical protein